jgi:cation diffusion facilitator CzcD-associated flavoprotein CzcO
MPEMTAGVTRTATKGTWTDGVDHEAIVIGAGVCGIYSLYRLRDMEMDVVVLEAGSDVGGTWYWNRYPGCRFDSESVSYAYSFSEELLQEWDWKERFSPQPETLRYLEHVVERFDLRRHMVFDTAVTDAVYDAEHNRWTVTTDDGTVRTCRFLLPAVGLLSVPTRPTYPGMEAFAGESFHTFDWPREGIDLSGRRVGVIGTGATAIQLIAAIAPVVGELRVFQRRANWAAPLHNSLIDDVEQSEIKASYDEIFARCAATPGGFLHGPVAESFHDATPEQRRAFWEELYGQPGFAIWLANYREVLMEPEANAEFSAFIADKIRERVHDPEVAELLIPTDHGFGVQRVPMETNYFEAYNLDHVHLVDVARQPITEIVPEGIRVGEVVHELDVIIYATGFDAITGAFDKIRIVGADGRTLRDTWSDDPRTYLGFQVAGFPNLLLPEGPQGATPTTNFPRIIEVGVDWVTALLEHMRDVGASRVECRAEAEEAWQGEVRHSYDALLLRQAKSWFTGYNSNIEGRDRMRHMMYNGGAPRFRKRLDAVVAAGYEGFDIS